MFTEVHRQKHFGIELKKVLSPYIGSYCVKRGKMKSMQSIE